MDVGERWAEFWADFCLGAAAVWNAPVVVTSHVGQVACSRPIREIKETIYLLLSSVVKAFATETLSNSLPAFELSFAVAPKMLLRHLYKCKESSMSNLWIVIESYSIWLIVDTVSV